MIDILRRYYHRQICTFVRL